MLLNLLSLITGERSVDQILATFSRLLAQLKRAEEAHLERAGNIAQEIERLSDLRVAALNEASRAAKAANKIFDLID